MPVWYNMTYRFGETEDENIIETHNSEDDVQFYIVICLVYFSVIIQFALILFFFCYPGKIYQRVGQPGRINMGRAGKQDEEEFEEVHQVLNSPRLIRHHEALDSRQFLETVPEESSSCNSDED